MTLSVVVGASGSGKTTFLEGVHKLHKCCYVRQYHTVRPYIQVRKIPNFESSRLPYWDLYVKKTLEGGAKNASYNPAIKIGGTMAGKFTAGLSGGRINRFNILKQSKDYDADGTYVKLWCPELAKVPAPSCHTPWLLSTADRERLGCGEYPPPLKTLGFKGPPPKKAKGGDRDKIKAKRRQKSRVQSAYL